MRQEFAEDYLSFYYWIKNGDPIPWRRDSTNNNLPETFAGTITSEYSGDNAAPLATELDNTTVEALSSTKKVIIRPQPGTVSLEMRFRSDGSEDDANILEIYAAAGPDHYRHIGQATLAQGTQIYSTGIYFNDGITITDTWITATAEPQPTNGIASLAINTHGYDRFLVVASDLVSTTVYVDFRRY